MRATIGARALPILLASGLPLFATSAGAVTFDFAAWADTFGEKGFDNSSPFTLTVAPLTVTATAYEWSGGTWTDANVYLDESTFTPPRPAGMGVCSVGLDDDDECLVSEDDNVTEDERLNLDFGQSIVLENMTFRDADHFPLGSGEMWFRVDGGAWTVFDFSDPWTPVTGTSFDFKHKNAQFYVETLDATPETPPIPEPATLGLLGTGLVLTALRARRRRL